MSDKNDAMKEVLDLIDKKAKRSRELRERSQDDFTPVEEVLNFLHNIEVAMADATDPLDYAVAIERETKLLDSRMKIHDPYVHIEVHWNDTSDVNELRPLGVVIKWSKYHIRLNPDKPEEEYVDVGRLLLDDF